MIEERNDWVGCDGLPCVPGCSRGRYIALVCDRCEEEVERLYKFDGEELCADCVLDQLESITLN